VLPPLDVIRICHFYQKIRVVVRLSAVVLYRAALLAAVRDDEPLFGAGGNRDRLHNPAAAALPVAGVDVNVLRAQAVRTVVS